MRALILTCNTGEGHNSSAAAIKEEFIQRGIDCDIADALGFISGKLSEFISNWHVRIYRYAPKAFRSGYSYSEKHESIFSDQKLLYKCLASGVDRMYGAVIHGRYDLLVCVHVFSALMVTELKQRYDIHIGTCFVATDYTCSPSVAESNLDAYFIAHEALADEYVENGIPRNKLIATGIPIRQSFHESIDKGKAKKLLGLTADQQNVLLMCGSMGCGPVEELAWTFLEKLPDNCLLTVVCGTNAKLLRSLSKIRSEQIRVLGYMKNIPLLMSASELFLTKPGGISITEAAAIGVPMLLIDVVGGCEARNLQFFTGQGWAVTGKTPEELMDKSIALLHDPAALQRKAKVLKNAFQGDPATRIYDAVSAWTWNRPPRNRTDKLMHSTSL